MDNTKKFEDIKPTESRLIALFGQDIVDKIKHSSACFCEIKRPEKTYIIGYCDYRNEFYTTTFLPICLLNI